MEEPLARGDAQPQPGDRRRVGYKGQFLPLPPVESEPSTIWHESEWDGERWRTIASAATQDELDALLAEHG